MMKSITVAAETITDPLTVWQEYAQSYSRTLARYDHAQQADPDVISPDDVASTRVIASRISNAQAADIVRRSEERRDLLASIPACARLSEADPSEENGLYDAMTLVFDALTGPGVRWAKVSKVLHLKRPALYPILDSALMRLYRPAAAEAAQIYPHRGFRRMYWAAVRQDLIANEEALHALRPHLAGSPLLSDLTDLRLLDILAWRSQHRPSPQR